MHSEHGARHILAVDHVQGALGAQILLRTDHAVDPVARLPVAAVEAREAEHGGARREAEELVFGDGARVRRVVGGVVVLPGGCRPDAGHAEEDVVGILGLGGVCGGVGVSEALGWALAFEGEGDEHCVCCGEAGEGGVVVGVRVEFEGDGVVAAVGCGRGVFDSLAL